jgi:hypothetical protein
MSLHRSLSIIAPTFIHTTHTHSPQGQQGHPRYSPETPLYQNYLAMSNTADVTGGKSIAVWSQSISGTNAINPLDAFYDPWKKERGAVLLFCPGHHTRRLSLDACRFHGLVKFAWRRSFFHLGWPSSWRTSSGSLLHQQRPTFPDRHLLLCNMQYSICNKVKTWITWRELYTDTPTICIP